MSSPRRLLGFDLDGTLVDAECRQVELVECLLAARGERLADPAAFWARKRDGATTGEALAAAGFGAAVALAVAGEWQRRIENPEWLRRDDWLPGARETLERVRALGVGVAVLTARRDPEALADQLSRLGLVNLADVVHVVSPEQAFGQKAMHLAAMAVIGYIGDSEHDYHAALRAGVQFVAVSTGQRSAEFLGRAGVPLIVGSLSEAVHRLESCGLPGL